MIVVISGVTGAGKTLIGSALAAELGWRFVDADEFHSPASIERMRTGIPLTDHDRADWLYELNAHLREAQRARENVVLACSALTRSYRANLTEGLSHVRFIQLTAPTSLIRGRLHARKGHFAGPALLDSQIALLEPGSEVAVVQNSASVPQVVRNIRALLRV